MSVEKTLQTLTLNYATPCITTGATGSSFDYTVPSNSYVLRQRDTPTINPPLPLDLLINVFFDVDDTTIYTIDFSRVDNTQAAELSFQVIINYQTKTIITSELFGGLITVGADIISNDDVNQSFIMITFHADIPSVFLPGTFDNLDTYTINTRCDINNTISVLFSRHAEAYTNTHQLDLSSLSVSGSIFVPSNQINNAVRSNNVNVFRAKNVNNYNNCVCTFSTTDTIRIPEITIVGQTTALYGNYLSDYTFTVRDNRCYNKGEHDEIGCGDYNVEETIKESKVKKTKFFEYGPPLQCVVKGKGKTLKDKVLYTYNKYQPNTGPSFQDFYNTLINYAMYKYFLGRLLYGTFDIGLLCKNKNKQFMCDLKHSRFSYYYDYLLYPPNGYCGYNQYFKKCC